MATNWNEQTGEHVSLYDGESVDWDEKKQAIAYATGLTRRLNDLLENQKWWWTAEIDWNCFIKG